MLNSRWILEFSFVSILSRICICLNIVLSASHVDGSWPLEFEFFQILRRICIFPNIVLRANCSNSRWYLEFALVIILILSADYGDSRWPRF